ncbi:MAG: ribokinase [Chloroflexota bacterium]|nr:MAG: ribokinase [Chloroflexota bacterium]
MSRRGCTAPRYRVRDRGAEEVRVDVARGTGSGRPPAVAVVGSMNIDLIAYAQRAPGPGETVIGDRFQSGFGGKGANQAVMARLLGAKVAFVGALGDDPYATMTLENFARLGVDASGVMRVVGSSGVAPIWVEADGTNRIIVVSGANDLVTPEHATEAVSAMARVDVAVGQFEIPQAVTAAGFAAARARGAVTILNPAPAAPILPALLAVTDWLIPNEVEFAAIGGSGADPTDAEFSAYARGTGTRLVVTLGSRGAALVGVDGRVARVPAEPVAAVDTTGAGDAFVGAFAVGMALGLPELDALRLGIACASDSVTRPGTQSSFPDPAAAAAILARIGRPG